MGQWSWYSLLYSSSWVGFTSFHPAELSLKLLMVFKASIAETGSKIKRSVVLVITYSVGLFDDRGTFFASGVPTFKKKLLNLSETAWPSSVISSLHLNLEFIRLYFLLLFYISYCSLNYLPWFFSHQMYVLITNHGNIFSLSCVRYGSIYFDTVHTIANYY